ncbi:cryptochrome/photolyase family protein [Cognatilysobacter bugurensis]|uniref:Deoxyribodipyrimidine photo-lyase n=1 Tax=Cognatilysobacter bugurensis TaxID=543356 RepID=A0A918W817_9GAMM|nr:deoxyribodipyrimidine photo-lyase [Lysobacter bugurensis]GHA79558.1 deoxyribodipyrimidine photo-lyase [Lysobacter bugurensis]
MPTALLWFRNDLRLDDHPALRLALERGFDVLCVYVHAPHEEGAWAPGAASNAWRARSLDALDAALQARGARLHCVHGDSVDALQRIAHEADARAVFWTRRYEPAIEARDAHVKRQLRDAGLLAQSVNGALLHEPWDVATKSGDPYRVFGAYWKTAQAQRRPWRAWSAPARIPAAAPGAQACRDLGIGAPASLGLAPRVRWDAGFWDTSEPGEAGALRALRRFIDTALAGYAEGRDAPACNGTSGLSAHLHFGEIAVGRVVSEVEASAAPREQVDAFVRQLGWREFAHHLLHHYPHTAEHNLDGRFDAFEWRTSDEAELDAWRRGRTGIPIIDAGMRELWHSGRMHNRVRMLVASLLTKHMRVHWSVGARWFWDTLVDADLANNALGWQWVAGTGADAAPYFRVFNPVLQARRFDPDGAYVRRWLPELAPLPDKAVFEPWTAPDLVRRIAPDYPRRPIVDLARGRDEALAAYQALHRT